MNTHGHVLVHNFTGKFDVAHKELTGSGKTGATSRGIYDDRVAGNGEQEARRCGLLWRSGGKDLVRSSQLVVDRIFMFLGDFAAVVVALQIAVKWRSSTDNVLKESTLSVVMSPRTYRGVAVVHVAEGANPESVARS